MNQRLLFGLALIALAAFLPADAVAATYFWDADTVNFGQQDGTGTWKDQDGAFANWWDESTTSNVPWNNANADTAVFGAGGIAVGNATTVPITVDAGGVTVGGIQFNTVALGGTNAAYGFTGGTITFAGAAPTINLATGSNTSGLTTNKTPYFANTVVTAAGSNLTISGDGTTTNYLNFKGANNFGGTVTVSNNTVLFAQSLGALNGATGVTIEAGCQLYPYQIANFSYAGALNITGPGPGTTTAPSVYLSSGSTNATFSGPMTVTGDVTLQCNASAANSAKFAGNIGGTGKLMTHGSVTLRGSNSHTGGTAVRGGVLALDSAAGYAVPGDFYYQPYNSGATALSLLQGEENGGNAQINPNSVINFANGIASQLLNLNGHTLTVQGIVNDSITDTTSYIQNLTGTAGLLNVNTNGNNYSYRGGIRNGTAGTLALKKSGLGTLTLQGGNCGLFTGGLTVAEGTLALSTAAPDSFSSPQLIVQNGATLDVLGKDFQSLSLINGQTIANSGTFSGNLVTLAGGTYTGSGTVTNNLTMTGGNLAPGADVSLVGQSNVTGNLDMSSVTVSTMTWNLGALSTANPGVNFDLMSVGGDLLLGGAATLALDFNLLPADQRPDSGTPNVFWSSTHSWKIIDTASNTTGTNFSSLTNASFNTGVFTTSVGVGANAGDLFLNFVIGNDIIWAGNAANNVWNLNTTANWVGSDGKFHTLDKVTFNDSGVNSPDVTLAGDLSPSAMIFNNSSKDYTFSGSGGITGNSTSLAINGSGKVTFANSGAFAIGGNIAVNSGTLAFNRADTLTLVNLIEGAGALEQNGTGTLILAGNLDGFTGSMKVANGGVLDFHGALLAPTVAVTVADGSALVSNAASGAGNNVQNLTFTGDATLGGSSSWTVGGNFTSNGYALTKTGAATITFNALGATGLSSVAINEGALQLQGNTSLGSAPVNIDHGALAFYASTPAHSTALTVGSGGGTLSLQTADNASLAGDSTLNGQLTTSAVTGGTFTLSSNLSGAGGSLVKTGGGTVVLTGNNTYAGDTTLSGGTLMLNSAAGFAVPGSITYTAAATLGLGQGEENGGNAQVGPAGVVNFATDIGVQYLNLNGHTLSVAGINNASSLDTNSAIQNAAAGTAGALIVNVPASSVSSYRGILRDNGGTLAVVKRGPGDLAIQGGVNSGQYTGGLTVEEGRLDYSAGTLPTVGLIAVTGGTLDIGAALPSVSAFRMTGGTLAGAGTLTSSTDYDLQGGTSDAILGNPASINLMLKKTGSGTATLRNAAQHAGITDIQAGTLVLADNAMNYTSGSLLNSPAIRIAAGAAFDVSGLATPFVLGGSYVQALQGSGTVTGTMLVTSYSTVSPGIGNVGHALTFNNNLDLAPGGGSAFNSASLDFHLSADALGVNNDSIPVLGTLTLPSGAGVTVNVAVHGLGTALDTANSYTLLTYGSLAGGSVGANLNLVNNTRYTMSLSNVPPAGANQGKIKLSVSGAAPKSLTWSNGSSWDLKNSASWVDASNTPQQFYDLDAVTFDNSTDPIYGYVSLYDTLYPSSITVNNDASHPYQFASIGKISGTTGIAKTGDGSLALMTANDFSGPVAIAGGVVTLGSPTALGATDGGTTVFGTGALDLSGQAISSGEAITIAGSGAGGSGALVNNGTAGASVSNLVLADNATIGGSSNWTINGATGSLVGNGHALTKTGTATIFVNGLGETGLGSIAINQGVLQFQGNTATISTPVTTAAGGQLYAFQIADFSSSGALDLTGPGPGTTTKPSVYLTSGSTNATFSGPMTVTGDVTLQCNASAANSAKFTGNISGTGKLMTHGSVTLRGSNSHTGGTAVRGGELSLDSPAGYAVPGDFRYQPYATNSAMTLSLLRGEEGGGNAQISPTSVITFASTTTGGQTLNLNGHTLTVQGIVNDSITDTASYIQNLTGIAGLLNVNTNGNSYSYRGGIRNGTAGTLALKKGGLGTLTLLGGSSGDYTGGLTVEGGTLDYSAGALPLCDYTVTGGTLNIGALSQSIGKLKVAGGLIEATTATLTSNTDLDIQGGTIQASLAGATTVVGLTKTTAATATLTGNMLYTGNTIVYDGILNATAINTPAAMVAVAPTGTLNAQSIVANSLNIGSVPPAAAAVPEPGTLMLLILAGLASIGAYRRRQ